MTRPEPTVDELAARVAEMDRRLDAVELQLCGLVAQLALLQVRQVLSRRARQQAETARAVQLARWNRDDHPTAHEPQTEPDTEQPAPEPNEDLPGEPDPEGRGR